MLLKKIIRFPLCCLLVFPLVMNAQKQPDSTRTDAFLEEIMKQYPHYFDSIIAHRQDYNVQVIYTKIDRGANGIAGLKHYYFNVNPTRNFAPGSAAKLPVAILTLQKLASLKQYGVDKNTTMLTGKAYAGQTAVYNEPTSPNGKPTPATYLKKMLLVSDGDAYNRLYELLGQHYINNELQQKGYTGAQITERLDADISEDGNRHTNPVQFVAPGNKVLYDQPAQFNTAPFALRKDSANSDTGKSRITLEDFHTMMVSLLFPNKVTASQRFNISDEDRKYILKYMSQLPPESSSPPYIDEPEIFYPGYCKYLLLGAEKDTIPADIRIFNASGKANGTLVDIAYVVDFDKKVEFFLSAVITDGVDEDETITVPFMKHLGKVIYDYEVKREKKNMPALEELKFEYDGR